MGITIMGKGVKMIDPIDRQAAIEAIRNCTDYLIGSLPTMIDKAEAQTEIMMLPSAQKTGRWERYIISLLDGEGCRCSECRFEGVPYWDYCPNCGARMEGVND